MESEQAGKKEQARENRPAQAYEPVIGLEVHAELETESKMFCACPVVDPDEARPNTAVCPVCTGFPGVLPVVNRQAVEFALRVALALSCEIAPTSIFARKNYFYPDLPKGYQISQYEHPLARDGRLAIRTSNGEKAIRIRRVHLEEDTGKLTHVATEEEAYTLIDLNRSGVALLEIVTEPDLTSAEEVRLYAEALRSLLRYVKVNSGKLQKGVLRIEPNVSVRPAGSRKLGTRVEIKNLNSFRALERSVNYEIHRQTELLKQGKPIRQETVGWDVEREVTFTQRVKETEDDYRYFPEPDLPPLVVDSDWIESVRRSLPELPDARWQRFQEQYGLSVYDASVLIGEQAVADYFESAAAASQKAGPKVIANWITGELFSLLNQSGAEIAEVRIRPEQMAELVDLVAQGEINQGTAKNVLNEMFLTGKTAKGIISEQGLAQISDPETISRFVSQVLKAHPEQVEAYLNGQDNLQRWLFGQVMRAAGRQANPKVVQTVLEQQLQESRAKRL